MSAGLAIPLLLVGLALALWVIHIEVALTRRRRNASYRLQAQERAARADTRPYGHVETPLGIRRLP